MTFVGHAFIDWDDTVTENIRYFNETERTNTLTIAQATGCDPDIIRRRGQEIDVAVARRMGLVQESFPTAWVECYREFTTAVNAQPDPAIEQVLREYCRFPYEVRQELLPGAAETLIWLHGMGFELTIWTAGEDAVQRRKVNESGLSHLIHRTEVVVRKSPEQLVAALGLRERSRCFVVGNSMHSDIGPALALGIKAFHVPTETWGYDNQEIDLSDPRYRMIASLADLPGVLVEHFEFESKSIGNTGDRAGEA